MSEETLSDKIEWVTEGYYIWKKDVKNFIKKLKEEIGELRLHVWKEEYEDVIDKLAGKELSK